MLANAIQARLSVLSNESPNSKPFLLQQLVRAMLICLSQQPRCPRPTTPWLLVPKNSIIVSKLLRRSTIKEMKEGDGAAFSPTRIRCTYKISKLFIFQKFFHLKRTVLTFLRKTMNFCLRSYFELCNYLKYFQTGSTRNIP